MYNLQFHALIWFAKSFTAYYSKTKQFNLHLPSYWKKNTTNKYNLHFHALIWIAKSLRMAVSQRGTENFDSH